jgi:hypothetical protein
MEIDKLNIVNISKNTVSRIDKNIALQVVEITLQLSVLVPTRIIM